MHERHFDGDFAVFKSRQVKKIRVQASSVSFCAKFCTNQRDLRESFWKGTWAEAENLRKIGSEEENEIQLSRRGSLVPTAHRISSSKDGSASGQASDEASLCNRNGLLLHWLQKCLPRWQNTESRLRIQFSILEGKQGWVYPSRPQTVKRA